MSSVPGPFGIGTFSEEAVEVAKLLCQGKVSYWQVLPFTPPAAGDSPYTAYSAFAGCPWFIDPRELGCFTEEEIASYYYGGPPYEVDYNFVRENSERYLREAFERVTPEQQMEIAAFVQEEAWLPDYALFMAIRQTYQHKPWFHWDDPALRMHEQGALAQFAAEHPAEIQYHYFCQWAFRKQWLKVKAKINQLGVGMIGDIPIYVADDSSDTWAQSALYLFDAQKMPIAVAGVPPDYFSEDGQLWGNPLYDWDYHKAQGYQWWIDRMKLNLLLFDAVRMDHFRAFESYWSVPVGAKTAKEGRWVKGPGMDLFRAIQDAIEDPHIIAEDLGIITEDVHQLLLDTGYPGMMVMQFALGSFAKDEVMPHRSRENQVVYTGTHDNNTLLGWVFEDEPEHRQMVLDYVGFPEQEDWTIGGWRCPFNRAVIRQTWSLPAYLTVTTMQDLLGYGSDARMNIPGTPEGNWAFKVPMSELHHIDVEWLSYTNTLFDRANRYDRDVLDAKIEQKEKLESEPIHE